MSDAKVVLERFNKVSFAFDILLVILFFTLGFFGLTLLVPADHVIGIFVQSAATLVGFAFGFGSLKTAEYLTNLVRLKLEEAVEDAKTDEERAAPVPVVKKAISAEAPPAPTLSNKVIKTTKVVMKANPVKRGRPATTKKEG